MTKNTDKTEPEPTPEPTPEARAALDAATGRANRAVDAKSAPDRTGITAKPVVKSADGFKIRNH